jgi:hypothetical protein
MHEVIKREIPMLRVSKALDNLSKARKYFYMEADFQIALVKELERSLKGDLDSIELEHTFNGKSIDIFIKDKKGTCYAIELKYYLTLGKCADSCEDDTCKKAKVAVLGLDELIRKDGLVRFGEDKSAGYNLTRESFCNDVKKLEEFVDTKLDKCGDRFGCAIFLTNDMYLWSKKTREGYDQYEDSKDKNYKIFEGATIGQGAGLKGSYKIEKWNDYGEDKYGFKYLLLNIFPKSK